MGSTWGAPAKAARVLGIPQPATLPAGPSITIDTACSSSLLALQSAYQAIRGGECSAAVVGGLNVLLKPNSSLQFMKLGMLSQDGTCRSFDAEGEGAERRGAAPAPPLAVQSSWPGGGTGRCPQA